MHTMGNYTLEKIKKLTRGTNGSVYTCNCGVERAVLKIYSCGDANLRNELIKKNRYFRNILSEYINIPKVFYISNEKTLLSILEEYTGITLYEYLKHDAWTEENIDILLKCLNLIKSFPENIPLDINPRNFTIDASKNIYFVDFMPPDPWDFLGNTALRESFEKCFPSVVNAYDRRKTRIKRYYLNKYRIIKFLHHLDITQ